MSSVLGKRILGTTAKMLNDMLRDLCGLNNFIFLPRNEIKRHHLYEDNIHLNDEGTNIFASNLLESINRIYNDDRRF